MTIRPWSISGQTAVFVAAIATLMLSGCRGRARSLHRDEFFATFGVPAPSARLDREDQVDSVARAGILTRLDGALDSVEVSRYLSALGILQPDTVASRSRTVVVKRRPHEVTVWVPDRRRWWEWDVCDWSYRVVFAFDSVARLRDVGVSRIGSCV